MATPIITRQYGPTPKGSPLSFSDLDTNFLYFKNIATTTAGTFPIIGEGEKTVDAGGGVTIVYPAGQATTESIMRQEGGFGNVAGEIIVNGSASFSGSIGVTLTASFTYATGSFTGKTNGTHDGVSSGSFSGSLVGTFVGSASGSFKGTIDGTASYTNIPLQDVLTSGNTSSIGFRINNGNVNLNGGTLLFDNSANFTVNGTSLLNGTVTTQNTNIGNTSGDVHTMTGSFTSNALTIFNERVTASAPVSINSTLGITGIHTSTNTTNSTTSSNGSIISAGGLGIGKDAYVSGALNIAGVATLANGTDATTTTAAGTLVTGGLGIAKQLRVGSTASFSAAVVMADILVVSGTVTYANNADATTTSTGAIVTAGGVGIAKALWVGGLANIAGAVTVGGATQLNSTVGATGVVTLTNATEATSISTGAAILSGGLGMAKNLWVGGTLNVAGAVTLGTITGTLANALSVDDSSLQLNSGTTYTNAAARTISVKTSGITNAMLAGSIANAKLSNSTISGVALGSNLNALTIGTGLSGTSYNGSSAVTIANTGVTSNVAGTNITVSGATGAVTINVTGTPTFSGNVTAAGFFQSSKRSLKTSIMPFEKDALDIIRKTNIVEFFYLTDLGNKHIGFIADDTPVELATKNQDTMDTNSTLAVALKAIQQLEARVLELEKKLENK